MSNNLALWQSVEKTDTSQTKAITGKPYQGTSPKPYYLIRKATETFGPCGIGWGFLVVNERVEDGAAGDKVHIAHVRVWYKWNDERGEIEHVGQTMFSGKRNNGNPYTDEDAPKKSVTDAVVKALSMIGFAGDIFMGRYDDSKYVSELKQEERERAGSPAQAQAPIAPVFSSGKPAADDERECDALIESMARCQAEAELNSWQNLNAKTIEGMSEPSKARLRATFLKRRTALRNPGIERAA